jgi:hypothetical protein
VSPFGLDFSCYEEKKIPRLGRERVGERVSISKIVGEIIGIMN